MDDAAPDPVTPAAPAAAQPGTVEPTIAEPEVSFEPTSGADDEIAGSPPAAAPADAAPPPPPPDPLVDHGDIVTARATAEAPPAPPAHGREPATEITEPEPDPFRGATEEAVVVAVEEEVVAAAVEDSREPAVTIPHRDEAPHIRSSIPRPLGADSPAATEVPRPIDVQREEGESPAARDEPPRRVAVPGPTPGPTADDADELPPLDGRFHNPGLLGQGVQLLLLVSAALSVAMMVSLIVLNNRLDTYATTGESLSRIMSAESMVNAWMRPLLIGAIVVTYALLATWARRVLENLHAFNNGMEETPLWMWMMPFVNMWVLFRHLDLGWKGSDYVARGSRTWQRGVPDVWTVLFVLLPTLGFVLVLYAWVSGADTFERAIDSNAFSIIGYSAISGGLLAGVRSITNIIDRQRTRVEGIR